MRFSRFQSGWPLSAAVLLAALFSRLYRLGWHLLWVDEIYSLNVSRMGIAGILENSLYEPVSPLFYFLLKTATWFGRFTSEGFVRLIPALAGGLAIWLLFHLARRTAGLPAALAGLVFLLLSPTVMFYSQETRAYMLAVLAAALSTAWIRPLLDPKNDSRLTWAVWGLAGLFGIYAHYSYFFVLGVQAAFLFWLHRFRRSFIFALAILALLCLPLLGWLGPQFAGRLDDTHLQALTLPWVLQTLVAADPARYGRFWGTSVMAWTFGGAALLGLVRQLQKRDRFGVYLLAQILVPLIGFFVIGTGFLGLHLPNFQSRQFLVLLPAIFLWALLGLGWAFRRLPAPAGAGLLLTVSLAWGAAGWNGLEQYWRQDKSPEGRAVVNMRQQIDSGDAVVSLHHSTSYALGRYLPDWPAVFAFPQQIEGTWYFDENRFFLGANFFPDPLFPLEDVKAHPRIWLLSHRSGFADLPDLLADGCRTESQAAAGPFALTLIVDCP